MRLARGRDRIAVEAVDPAGSAREGEVVVRCGVTWPEAGPVAAVVAGSVAARWAMLGREDGRRRPAGGKGRRSIDGWARR